MYNPIFQLWIDTSGGVVASVALEKKSADFFAEHTQVGLNFFCFWLEHIHYIIFHHIIVDLLFITDQFISK